MSDRNDERDAVLSTRRQVLLAGAAAGAALLLPSVPRVARAAGTAFDYTCKWQSGLLPDPNQHQRVGYLTDFAGLGIAAPLAKDLTVYVPWPGPAAPAYTGIALSASQVGSFSKTSVVGVLERLSWPGGLGDAIQIDAWMSQQNAFQLKAQQQALLATTLVSTLGYWVLNFDQEAKVWYEQAYPLTPTKLGGKLGGGNNPMLNVDLTGAPAASGIDVTLYKVSMSIVPAANQASTLQFATTSSASTKVTKPWGMLPPVPFPPPTSFPAPKLRP